MSGKKNAIERQGEMGDRLIRMSMVTLRYFGFHGEAVTDVAGESNKLRSSGQN